MLIKKHTKVRKRVEKMAENQKVEEVHSHPDWKRKFLANRAALEQILFERDIIKKKETKNYFGPIGLFAILAIGVSVLFWNWKLSEGFISADSAAKIAIAHKYISSLSVAFGEFFFKADLFNMNFDLPFYYLSYFPVFKFITSDKSLAIFIVNAFYYCVFVCSIYFSVNIRGNYKAGLMAALIGAFFPFWFSISREFSVSAATCAITALTYLFFIKSEDMENPVWVFPMAISFAIGLITDKMYIFYVLPLLHWLNWGFAGLYRGKILKAMFIAAIIGVPFYLRILVKFIFFYLLRGQNLFEHFNFNFFWYLPSFADAANLILFIIGMFSLIWMKFTIFELYEKRTIIWKWFISSYVILWLFPVKDHSYVYGALAPMAIASGIMIPDLFRKYFIIGVLSLGIFNHSGLLGPISVPFFKGKAIIFGMKTPPSKTEKVHEILKIVKENIFHENTTVAVFGKSKYINSASLSSISHKYSIPNEYFRNYPSYFASFADIAVLKGNDTIKSMPPYFKNFFKEIISFNDGDISIYSKNIPAESFIRADKSYVSSNLDLLGFNFTDVFFKFSGINEKSKTYDLAEMFIPYASIGVMDFYNTKIVFKDLCLASYAGADFVCGFSSVEIKNIKTTSFSFSRFMEERLKKLTALEIKTEGHGKAGIFTIYGSFLGTDTEIPVLVYSQNSSLYLKIMKIEYGGFRIVPSFLSRFLTFEISNKDMIVPLKFKSVKFQNDMIVVL